MVERQFSSCRRGLHLCVGFLVGKWELRPSLGFQPHFPFGMTIVNCWPVYHPPVGAIYRTGRLNERISEGTEEWKRGDLVY